MTPARVVADADEGQQGLLERFLADVVVDDYDLGDAGAPTDSADRRPRAWIATLLVTIMIGGLIAGAMISTRFSTAERQQTREALAERVALTALTVQEHQQSVDELQGYTDALQSRIIAQGDAIAAGAGGELDALSAQAGTAALSGPGVTVTIDDAPSAEAGSLNRVLDRDVQDIVNMLWASGATGIAVNDQRLTATTAIRSAGEAILVNYQPLTRPYRIQAVGTSQSGSRGPGLEDLLGQLRRDYGLVSEQSTGDVALPAGQLRSPRFATPSVSAGGIGITGSSSEAGSP